ncbi:hypothetical protein X805_39450 [Sphaerotilus natans subsp. natans DSM 6575]|uniref:AAA+ ATPase domain-containing protein n=1 Tax=Sphaerotilus natans subsp. natans DSM 6575 TaxID=1286631 RepID=A0A059KH51_9BURK|nr:ATP-binding protein [Sphaerotilus natans]KDB50428.1 hypothetical protein X805_39450 [Sphaerotilus natans subsp. natans DSM 6575]SIP97110.1 ATPase/GTPase, AAA15 family [Sphaerotilus natans]
MLNALVIRNFRCLQDFHVGRLGRVNLIVGRNNAGKSTVLEALSLHAGRASREVIERITQARDESPKDLFPGHGFPAGDDWTDAIQIGDPTNPASLLRLLHAHVSDTEEHVQEAQGTVVRLTTRRVPKQDLALFPGRTEHALFVLLQDRPLATVFLDSDRRVPEPLPAIPCGLVRTRWMPMDALAAQWDRIVFTEHEDIVRRALRLITPEFENLTFVQIGDPAGRHRSAKVKLSNTGSPVALKSLGDGMQRILQIALQLVSARGGLLLIDEFENGLHYSVQEQVWSLLFEMAERLDIQIFATTHSWDCIESFARVARQRQDIDGVLFRMGRSLRHSDRGRIIATVFDEAALHDITQAEVEVR